MRPYHSDQIKWASYSSSAGFNLIGTDNQKNQNGFPSRKSRLETSRANGFQICDLFHSLAKFKNDTPARCPFVRDPGAEKIPNSDFGTPCDSQSVARTFRVHTVGRRLIADRYSSPTPARNHDQSRQQNSPALAAFGRDTVKQSRNLDHHCSTNIQRTTKGNFKWQKVSAQTKDWPKSFQNLRSTRQTELEEEFPSHVVCAWIGNSQAITAKHYLQVTDEHFKLAAENALQNPVQSVAVSDQIDPQSPKTQKTVKCSPEVGYGSGGYYTVEHSCPARI